MAALENIIGNKFGKLTVKSRAGNDSDGRVLWNCLCDCGKKIIRSGKWLKNSVHKDCGCHFLKNKDTKICSACGVDKPKSEYNKRNGKPSGVQARCIKCNSEYKKKRYWGNHEVELAKATKSRIKPENVLQRRGYYKKKYKKMEKIVP